MLLTNSLRLLPSHPILTSLNRRIQGYKLQGQQVSGLGGRIKVMAAATIQGSRGYAPEVTTMATAQSPAEIRIASDAMDVLGCYVDEFDQIVYGLAKENAAARLQQAARGGVIVVEIEDVKKAAETFTSAIKAQFGDDPKHAPLIAAIEGMQQCLNSRCEQVATQK